MQAIIERRCLRLLQSAIDAETTDIHIKPEFDSYSVSFRSFQAMQTVSVIPFDLGDRMIAYFKYLSLLDMSERRKPQTGSFQQTIDEVSCFFRISTLPSVLTRESIVIRIVSDKTALPLEELALFRDSARLLKKLAASRQGLFLLTGPTGCGKSTTLYSLLNHCNSQLNRNIITLEDPVERKNQTMLQIQVNEKAGLSYAAGLKAILRHDPDIIMIGEIRDADTAKIAVRAALTGHLVFSTIHARNAAGCLHRLHDLEVSYEDLSHTLVAISAQQLVPAYQSEEPEQIRHAALFEVLYGAYLEEATEAARNRRLYRLPEELSLTGQVMEGVKIGAIPPHFRPETVPDP
ncbi:competence type IV pilus ATPase ComGA [Planococcus lenghuensis]|uniref:Competence protein ComG n=1 Tax=Planococcus lenghuensis TaxID=2213202 RepID=A0A1Q2KXQ5_9BACL|nr:competence type IV pilus ATPase ComGA [Planococcus lenghuensis]AQQ53005.1 competence protein ComG [Planococcus lenghuensis]